MGTGWQIEDLDKAAVCYLRYLKEEGPIPLASRALRVFFTPVFRFRKEMFYLRSLDEPAGLTTTGNPGVRVLEFSVDESSDLRKVMYVNSAQIRRWLVDGKRCFVGMVGKEIAHYSWVSTGEEYVPAIDQSIQLSRGEVWIHTCRTLRSYRGRGIFAFVLEHICQILKAEGFKTVVIAAGANNSASLKSFQKAGFHRAGELTYLKMFGWQRQAFRGHLPWLRLQV